MAKDTDPRLKGAAKVIKHLRVPGQTISEAKASWDELSYDDRVELVDAARHEGIID